jgi:hypothetical protein
MQLPIKLTAFFFIVFAAVCLWFAIDLFTSLASIADPVEASGAKSFVWFLSFLFVVGVVLGLVSWKIAQAQLEDKDA